MFHPLLNVQFELPHTQDTRAQTHIHMHAHCSHSMHTQDLEKIYGHLFGRKSLVSPCKMFALLCKAGCSWCRPYSGASDLRNVSVRMCVCLCVYNCVQVCNCKFILAQVLQLCFWTAYSSASDLKNVSVRACVRHQTCLPLSVKAPHKSALLCITLTHTSTLTLSRHQTCLPVREGDSQANHLPATWHSCTRWTCTKPTLRSAAFPRFMWVFTGNEVVACLFGCASWCHDDMLWCH